MSGSQTAVEPKHKLSTSYKGWRPNKRSPNKYLNNNDSSTKTKPIYNIYFNPITYSPEERISRSITSVLCRLTPDNFNKLLPKIKAVYADVDNMNKLQRFLSIIFERAIMEPFFHLLFVNTLNALLADNNMSITYIDFTQYVSSLCDSYFEKYLQKSMISSTESIDKYNKDYEWIQLKRKRFLLSVCRFNAILASKQVIDIAMLIQYMKVLLEDVTTETNVEAACDQFNEIVKYVKLDYNTIKIKNAELNTIDVAMKAHLLVYGYIGNNVPKCVIDYCIGLFGYYDVNCYFLKYYQKLQDIEQNPLRGKRIRMLIQNMIDSTTTINTI